MNNLAVVPKDIKGQSYYLDNILKESRFYKLIRDNSKANEDEPVCSSVLNFFSMQKAIYTGLSSSNSTELKGVSDNFDEYHKLYSAYISAVVCLENISGQKSFSGTGRGAYSSYALDFSKGIDAVIYDEISVLENKIKSGEQSPIEAIRKFYREVIEQTVKEGTAARHLKINKQYSEKKVTVELRISEKDLKSYEFLGMSRDDVFSRKNNNPTNDDNLTWDTIGGYSKVKKFFQSQVFLIQNYEKAIQRATPKIIFPRGILLYGPAGTGKTTMCNLFAKYAGIPIISTSVNEIGDSHVFGASNKLTEKFEQALEPLRSKDFPASVICIDELESIASQRTNATDGSKEYNNLVTIFNIYMDGKEYVPGLIVIGATNEKDKIDFAIRSRFRKQFEMGYPKDKDETKEVLLASVRQFEREINIPRIVDPTGLDAVIEESFNRELVGRDFRNILDNIVSERLIPWVSKGSEPYPIPASEILDSVKTYEKPVVNY